MSDLSPFLELLLPKEYNKDMKKIINHGSDHAVTTPAWGLGNVHNDFGDGFYCTETLNMAKEWGVREGRNGYANKYYIELDGLSVLNLTEGYSTLEWLTILLENRVFDDDTLLAKEAKEYLGKNFNLNYKDYDILIGYRADDSYFSFASDFINGVIPYRVLCSAMKLGRLGEQFVLKSRRSFSAIEFLSIEEAKWHEWYPKKTFRLRAAQRDYFESEKNRRVKGDIYITEILDKEIKRDDTRLR